MTIRAYWADGSPSHREALRAGLTPAATRSQYLNGVHDASRIDPDSWVIDQALLDRPGVGEIMLDLFFDYRENVAIYPRFAYLRDLPDAGLHLLDTGHFALEDRGDRIAALMLDFLDRKLRQAK